MKHSKKKKKTPTHFIYFSKSTQFVPDWINHLNNFLFLLGDLALTPKIPLGVRALYNILLGGTNSEFSGEVSMKHE